VPGTLDILIEPTADATIAVAARALPARPGVVAFEADDGRTVLLAATGDLRRFALTRLGQHDDDTPAKREDLSGITARLRARIVGSSFEGDALYLEQARWRLPATYRSVLDTRRAWFVQLDADAQTPLWRKLDVVGATARGEKLDPRTLLGPIGDKDAAGRFGERLDDLFDLCRYPKELEATPNGRACAYKEMGRCDAPCDGSAPMDDYRARVRDAVRFASQPTELTASAIESRMARASADQDFELAASLKDRLERVRNSARPATAWTTCLDTLRVLAVMPSTKRGWARLLVCDARRIVPYADARGDLSRDEIRSLIDSMTAFLSAPEHGGALEPDQAEGLGLLSHHLFHPKRGAGAMLRLAPAPDASALGTLIRRAARVRENGADAPREELEAELGAEIRPPSDQDLGSP